MQPTLAPSSEVPLTSPFLDRLTRGPLLADGAMGTYLYAQGISFEHNFDELNLSQPRIIGSVHRAYLAAGADLVETNTFGANRMRLAAFGLEDKVRLIARQGARIARDAREVVGVPAFVAGSMGPLGRPLAPFGTVAADEAEGLFREAAEGLLEGGVDLFVLETFGDLGEILVALRAIRSLCTLPVMALMTFTEDGRSIVGHLPANCYAALADAGADVVGANCSVGPQATLDVVQAMEAAREARPAGASRPALAAMPNAGLPQMVAGRYVYVATPEYFGAYARRFVEAGAGVVGGCCGTTPEHIARMRVDLPAVAPDPATLPAPRPEAIADLAPTAEPVTPGDGGEPAILGKLRERFFVSVELDPPRGINPQKILAGAGLLAQQRRRRDQRRRLADGAGAHERAGADLPRDAALPAVRHDPALHLPRPQPDGHPGRPAGRARDGHHDHPRAHRRSAEHRRLPERHRGLRRRLGGADPHHQEAELRAPTWRATRSASARASPSPARSTRPPTTSSSSWCASARRSRPGADFAMTQPFYDMAVWDAFLARFGPVPIPVLLGILPLQSHRHAEFMHNEVPGITVPQELRDRLRDAGADAQAEGVRHARALLEAARGRFAGVYLMPSFGRYENVIDVLKEGA